MTVQLNRQRLEAWVDPAEIFAYLSTRHENVVWLDAGPNATEGYSYLGVGSGELITGNTLDALTSPSLIPQIPVPSGLPSQGGPFQLGYIGWLGYELGRSTVGIEMPESEHPALCFTEVRAALEFDHGSHKITLISHDEHSCAILFAAARDAQGIVATVQPESTNMTDRGTAPVIRRHSDEAYRDMVSACRRAIEAGNAYQLCLTNELSVEGKWDALGVYRRLRADNPSHHGALLSLGGVHLLSSSPEIFLRLTCEGHLSTKPIKGTRARGTTAQRDAKLVAELLESEKEQAENLMIVDLMRNDLSKVGVLGTVAAQNLLEVHTLPHVHQLVSTVAAELRPHLTAIDAVEAAFPAGSMTGAPKLAAMRILSELENGPRGIYSGAFGWFGLDGACELAMVIRSIVIDDSGASIGTGGGITIDSDPQAELEEMHLKSQPALRALGLV